MRYSVQNKGEKKLNNLIMNKYSSIKTKVM